MKKKIILLLSIACVLLMGLLICFSKINIGNYLWQKIDSRLDYELSLEVGDNFNKISWADLSFQINHHKKENNLEYVSTVNKEKYILLKNISSYRILKNCLYVKSLYGCAVIDENGFCKIYYKSFQGEQTNSYSYDCDGYTVCASKALEIDSIEYLTEYSEFSEDEIKIFEKMSD